MSDVIYKNQQCGQIFPFQQEILNYCNFIGELCDSKPCMHIYSYYIIIIVAGGRYIGLKMRVDYS